MTHWIKTEFGAGRIDVAIEEAKELAEKLNVGVEFTFNGISISVTKHSNPELLEKEYMDRVTQKTTA